MAVTLPFRCDSDFKLSFSDDEKIHQILEDIYENTIDPIDGVVEPLKFGRELDKGGIGELQKEGLLSTAQWAILIEGTLKGQCINGGIE